MSLLNIAFVFRRMNKKSMILLPRIWIVLLDEGNIPLSLENKRLGPIFLILGRYRDYGCV